MGWVKELGETDSCYFYEPCYQEKSCYSHQNLPPILLLDMAGMRTRSNFEKQSGLQQNYLEYTEDDYGCCKAP